MKCNHVYHGLATILSVVLLLGGCKDFLDVKPKGKDIPETIEHYNGMFNSTNLTSVTYSQVTELGTKLGVSTLYNIFMGDELTATQTSVSELDFKMNQAYQWEGKIFGEEDDVCEWATMYQQIYTFNVIINNVMDASGGTNKRKLELQAEARVNRAFRYLILAQYFGKPYNESTANSDLCVPLVVEDDMNLKNVDLDIAVNALIGSMVRNGYLDELDNAILVTVSNENEKKASSLRQDVVGDVESSLQEHAVQAVVYDQRMKVTGEIQDLAEKYNISYGKAYFLRELIRDNDLTENDMKKFAGMTMEEIAREIADRAYTVGYSKTDSTIETDAALVREVTLPQTEEETLAETTVESTGQPENEPTPAEQPSTAVRPVETTAAADEDEEEVDSGGKKAKIDYVDYESGSLNIVFKEKVKWKNPTVSVVDPDGQSYSARITDTGGTSCEIHVKGLPANTECTFTLGGVAVRDGGSFGTVKGYFETPDIADDLIDEDDDDADDETVETKPSETSRAPETLTEAVKESTHSETEYSQMETKQTEKETKTDAESAN